MDFEEINKDYASIFATLAVVYVFIVILGGKIYLRY